MRHSKQEYRLEAEALEDGTIQIVRRRGYRRDRTIRVDPVRARWFWKEGRRESDEWGIVFATLTVANGILVLWVIPALFGSAAATVLTLLGLGLSAQAILFFERRPPFPVAWAREKEEVDDLIRKEEAAQIAVEDARARAELILEMERDTEALLKGGTP